MSLHPTTVKVNGRNYMITDWSVDKALEILVWMTKTFGEGLLSIFVSDSSREALADAMESNEVAEDDVSKIMAIAEKFTRNLNAKEYAQYSKYILDGVICDGKKVDFSVHFSCKMGELHTVIFHTLRHQYGDFLGGNAEDVSKSPA